MTKPTAIAAALAACLMPFAASAAEFPAFARSLAEAVSQTAVSAAAVNEASLGAQSRIGFPADLANLPGLVPGSRYDKMIGLHAAANGVPISLARAVIEVESRYRPNARGAAGEVGLMQIKPATARLMGFRGSVRALFDPETNIRFGMKYLGMAHRLGGGTTCGTILKYNAGHAARRMNPVSRAYCGKVAVLLARG
jgi:soluble lytic murein transglycosylase-like protein